VSVRFAPGDDPSLPPRVAYAVGRRVGSAVARNRVRRRLRASVAQRADELVPGAAYLFEAEPAVLNLAFADLADTVAWLIRRTRERPS
jgi:ribonuclease P protein component